MAGQGAAQLSDEQILARCAPFTMTSRARQLQTLESVAQAVARGVPGDLVEIGVWRGGSVMIMLHKLLQLGVRDRDVHLYDTFSGMTEAADVDRDRLGEAGVRCEASLSEVRANVASVGYPAERVNWHVGDIRAVRAEDVPPVIAVLRLDNDWHELYRHELPIFEPRVAPGGTVTIDDYGWWSGCKLAVDDYLAAAYPADRRPSIRPIDGVGVYWERGVDTASRIL